MESIISAVFKVESEGYQMLTELRNQPVTEDYLVSQAVLVKKEDGKLTMLDAFDTGKETRNDTAIGGLVGALIGILGGPIGVLLGGGMGLLVGGTKDTSDAVKNASMMEKVTEQFSDGDVVLVALAQEENPGFLELKFNKFETSVIKEDAAEVADEVLRAQELQREMEIETKKRLREEKRADRQKSVEERRFKLKDEFDALKKKFSKQD